LTENRIQHSALQLTANNRKKKLNLKPAERSPETEVWVVSFPDHMIHFN